MARTLAQIQKQIDSLKKEAESLRSKEVADVVGRIQGAIAHYGLTAQDLFGGKGSKGSKGSAAAPQAKGKRQKRVDSAAALPSAKPAKAARAGGRPAGVIRFRDDAGNAWTGVGKRPRWFIEAVAAGKSPDDLRVK